MTEPESFKAAVTIMRSERYTASPLEVTASENNINRHNRHPGMSRHTLTDAHNRPGPLGAEKKRLLVLAVQAHKVAAVIYAQLTHPVCK